jgi:ABC-2 type transport system ATP-binding protein
MPTALEVEALTKSYVNRKVVDGVTFAVERGEIFGLLGPNGSGKTTTLRLALDIVKPDSGRVALLGEAPSRRVMGRVGYLPEERGLLRKERVADILGYLGRLKGMSAAEAALSADAMLRKVGLDAHRAKKVEALSRGMTQLVQFAAAIMHGPDLIILDEPFSGLDPLNVQVIKDLVREQQARGAAVIFSTHIMADVEELCERVALISDGHMLLYGRLDEIKRSRGVNGVRVRAARRPTAPAGSRTTEANGSVEYHFEGSGSPESVLRAYLDADVPIERFEIMLPTLNEVFIEEVSRARRGGSVGPVDGSTQSRPQVSLPSGRGPE